MRIRLGKRVTASFFLILIVTSMFFSFNFIPVASATIMRIATGFRVSLDASYIVTLSDTPSAGNVLVAGIAIRDSGKTITVTSITQANVTWTQQTYRDYPEGYNLRPEIWVGIVNDTTTVNATINLSGAPTLSSYTQICEYSGVATTSFLDQTANNYGTSAYPDTGTTSTTSQDEELWVGVIAVQDNYDEDLTSPTNDFSLLAGHNYYALNIAYLEKIVSSTGTANSGVTTEGTVSRPWVGCIATFKAESASGFFPYIQQTSDVDSAVDVGSHSNFTAQQYGPNSVNDTLTEANTGTPATITRGATVSVWSTSATTTGPSGTAFAHTVNANTSLLIVTIGMDADEVVSAVPVWNTNEPMTLIHASTASGDAGDQRVYTYGLVNPTAKSDYITFTMSSDDHAYAVAVNYIGTVNSSVADATNFLNETVNDAATQTTVLASGGEAGSTLFVSANFHGGDGYPASNDAGFAELADSQTGTSTIYDDAYYVADKIGGAPSAVTVDWYNTVSDENAGHLIEILPAQNTNYRLEIEEQFAEVPYSEYDTAKLCVFAGSFSGAEDLNVQVWNGTWNTAGVLTAEQWSNFTVTSYVNSSDLYIRFLGGLESSDSTQNTWQIDAVYLWMYNDTSQQLEFVLYATVSVTDSLASQKGINKTLAQTLTVDSVLGSQKALGKSLFQTVDCVSDIASQKAMGKMLAQTIVADSLFGSNKALAKPLFASVTVQDSFGSVKGISNLFSESVAALSELFKTRGFLALLAENIAVTFNFASEKALTKGLLESLTVASELLSLKSLTNLLLEVCSATSNLMSNKGIFAVLPETVTVLLDFSSAKSLFQNILETLSASFAINDLLTVQKGILKFLADATVINSVFASQKWLTQIIAEIVNVNSALDVSKGIFQTIIETLSASFSVNDLLATQKNILNLFSEATIVNGVLLSQKWITQLITEVFQVDSVLNTAKSIFQTILENLSATLSVDNLLATQKNMLKFISDTAIATVDLSALKSLATVIVEAIGTVNVDGLLSTSKTLSHILSEAIVPIANLLTQKTLTFILSGIAGLGDAVTAAINNIVLNVTVVLAETISAIASLGINFDIHTWLIEFVGTVNFDSYLNPHFPTGLFSIEDIVVGVIVGAVIAGVMCFALFVLLRKKE